MLKYLWQWPPPQNRALHCSGRASQRGRPPEGDTPPLRKWQPSELMQIELWSRKKKQNREPTTSKEEKQSVTTWISHKSVLREILYKREGEESKPLQCSLQFLTLDGVFFVQREESGVQAFVSQTAVRRMVLRETEQWPPNKHPATMGCKKNIRKQLESCWSAMWSRGRDRFYLYFAGYSPNAFRRATSLFLFRPAGNSF